MDNEVKNVQFGDPELMQHAAAEFDVAQSVFGVCPTCHRNDGYANAGKLHIFFCLEHRVRWIVGSNLFSSWKDQTEVEQRLIYDTIGLGDYTKVEPYVSEEAQGAAFFKAVLYQLPKHWRIEFLLSGKTEWYPGSALGTDEQDAIKTFLENHSPSMGIIVGIRVRGA